MSRWQDLCSPEILAQNPSLPAVAPLVITISIKPSCTQMPQAPTVPLPFPGLGRPPISLSPLVAGLGTQPSSSTTTIKYGENFWIETFNLQVLKNSDIPFQRCVAGFDALPRSNYIRGQNNSGDCLSTLNQDCVNAIHRLLSKPSASTESVCAEVAYQMTAQTPSECRPFGPWGDPYSAGSPT